jgi:integrase
VIGTTLQFPTESLARTAADGLRLEINKEAPNTLTNSITFGQLIAHYQQRELPDDMSQARVPKAHSTAVTYRRYLRRWIRPRWDAYLLQDIHSVAVEDWLYALKASSGTKAKIRNIMSAVFRHAIRYGFLPRTEESNPIKYVRQSAASDVIPTILTKDQVWKIIANLREPARTMAFLAAFTGLRISELLALKWADIDFARSQINVRRAIVYGVVGACKSKASKKPVALDPILGDALHQWRLKTPYSKPDDWVFASAKLNGTKPLNPSMLRKRHLTPAAKAAGVSGKVGWHTFRRTLASLFIAEGVDIKTVQESLRHSTSTITLDLYAQATTFNKLAAQRKLIETIVPKTQQPIFPAGLRS